MTSTTTHFAADEIPPSSRPPQLLREDCWSPEESHALIEAWGSHHLSLNRGHLRQQHWLEVSNAVNSAVTAAGKPHRQRTAVQCKNRIDTLKKKFKIEKAKSVGSSGDYISDWPFFARLDFLISGEPTPSPESSTLAPERGTPVTVTPLLTNFPVGRRSAIPKRPARRFPTVAEWGADSEDEKGFESRRWAEAIPKRRARRYEVVMEAESEEEEGEGKACRRLAEAIRRFGEVYERVEAMKQEQMVELEKRRMQLVKDLENQRMRLLKDTQKKLASIKRSKLSHGHAVDSYS